LEKKHNRSRFGDRGRASGYGVKAFQLISQVDGALLKRSENLLTIGQLPVATVAHIPCGGQTTPMHEILVIGQGFESVTAGEVGEIALGHVRIQPVSGQLVFPGVIQIEYSFSGVVGQILRRRIVVPEGNDILELLPSGHVTRETSIFLGRGPTGIDVGILTYRTLFPLNPGIPTLLGVIILETFQGSHAVVIEKTGKFRLVHIGIESQIDQLVFTVSEILKVLLSEIRVLGFEFFVIVVLDRIVRDGPTIRTGSCTGSSKPALFRLVIVSVLAERGRVRFPLGRGGRRNLGRRWTYSGSGAVKGVRHLLQCDGSEH